MSCIVFCTIPIKLAKDFCRKLVESNLVACCNISNCTSIYNWDDKIQEDEESIIMMKTTELRYQDLEVKIKTLHPYNTPEILKIEAEGSKDYIDWIHRTIK
eukprot:NODE_834_length_3613_cov_0.384178.p6 type:complete len:101 gc:universal NODE_834_length_3613_cov_0.384178:360-662(+)